MQRRADADWGKVLRVVLDVVGRNLAGVTCGGVPLHEMALRDMCGLVALDAVARKMDGTASADDLVDHGERAIDGRLDVDYSVVKPGED